MIKKGSFVEIMQVVLEPADRSNSIPEDTKTTPLRLWAKGILLKDGEIGDKASIITVTGRQLEGVITDTSMAYDHDFGQFIREILYIGPQAKSILWGDYIE
jgi:hypothetical protein